MLYKLLKNIKLLYCKQTKYFYYLCSLNTVIYTIIFTTKHTSNFFFKFTSVFTNKTPQPNNTKH